MHAWRRRARGCAGLLCVGGMRGQAAVRPAPTRTMRNTASLEWAQLSSTACRCATGSSGKASTQGQCAVRHPAPASSSVPSRVASSRRMSRRATRLRPKVRSWMTCRTCVMDGRGVWGLRHTNQGVGFTHTNQGFFGVEARTQSGPMQRASCGTVDRAARAAQGPRTRTLPGTPFCALPDRRQ
jgi:hypothetical protein